MNVTYNLCSRIVGVIFYNVLQSGDQEQKKKIIPLLNKESEVDKLIEDKKFEELFRHKDWQEIIKFAQKIESLKGIHFEELLRKK